MVQSPDSLQSTPSASSSKKRKKSQVDDGDMLQLMKENRKTREKILDFLVQNKNPECEDDVDLFYKSIAMSVKRLPKHLLSSAKTQHLQILTNLENEAANLQQGVIRHTRVETSTQPERSFDRNPHQTSSPIMQRFSQGALFPPNPPGSLGFPENERQIFPERQSFSSYNYTH